MSLKKALLVLLPVVALAGCDSNPTNAPSDAALKAADDKRSAAIDKDPSLTPQQKADMKSHLGLGRGPSGAAQKR